MKEKNTNISIEEILNKTSFGSFYKNNELLEQIFKLVVAENDKYPKRSLSNEFFPQYKLIRNRSNDTGNNVLKIFDDTIEKRNPPQIAQYSFSKRNFELFNHYDKKFNFYCLHHNDMDGYASASIVKRNYIEDMNYTPYNYNNIDFKNWINKIIYDRKNDKNKKEFILFAVDLSFKFSELKRILEIFDHVFWIDHHVTSLITINNISGESKLYKKLTYFIDTRFCATYLSNYFLNRLNYSKTIKFYIKEKNVKKEEIENLELHKEVFINNKMITASLINLYDLKLDKQFPEAYKYAVYLNSYYWSFNNINANSNVWYYLLYADLCTNDYEWINNTLSIGKELYEIEQRKDQIMFDNDYKYIFESEFNNNNISKLRIVGLFQFGSSNKIIGFEDNIPTIKMLIRYNEKDNSYNFSLYTDNDSLGKLNLAQIMMKYGLGGGHPKACGGTILDKDSEELSNNMGEFCNKKSLCSLQFHYKNNKLSNIFNISGKESIEEFKEITKKIQYSVDHNKIHPERYDLDIELLVKNIFCIIAKEIITKKIN